MKIDWTQAVTELDGTIIYERLRDDDGDIIPLEQRKPVTLGKLAIQSLLVGDEKTPPEEKFRRYEAARKIHGNEDITIEEAALVKQATGAVLTPLPMAVVWRALEGR